MTAMALLVALAVQQPASLCGFKEYELETAIEEQR